MQNPYMKANPNKVIFIFIGCETVFSFFSGTVFLSVFFNIFDFYFLFLSQFLVVHHSKIFNSLVTKLTKEKIEVSIKN